MEITDFLLKKCNRNTCNIYIYMHFQTLVTHIHFFPPIIHCFLTSYHRFSLPAPYSKTRSLVKEKKMSTEFPAMLCQNSGSCLRILLYKC